MKLEDYLYYEGISQRELARRLDIHYRYMHGLISGEYVPGRKMALHIQEITEGKVTALELLFPRPSKSTSARKGKQEILDNNALMSKSID